MLQHFKKYYIKYIISIVIAIAIMITANVLANNWTGIVSYVNGSFAAGATLICCGGLSWCASLGAYDMVSHMFAKRGPNGYKPSLYEYSEQKKQERRKNKLSFLPYLLTGAAFVIVSLILYIFM